MATYTILSYVWLLAAVITYGRMFAYLQGVSPATAENDRYVDIAASIVFAVFGPIGLIVVLFAYERTYGFKFW